MAQVGNKKFGYDPVGMSKARKESNATGRPISTQPQYKGGVAPMDPNKGAVNSFMNNNAISELGSQNMVNPNTQSVAKLQNGLNFLNKNNPNYTSLKVDGVMGPKTQAAAKSYLG